MVTVLMMARDSYGQVFCISQPLCAGALHGAATLCWVTTVAAAAYDGDAAKLLLLLLRDWWWSCQAAATTQGLLLGG